MMAAASVLAQRGPLSTSSCCGAAGMIRLPRLGREGGTVGIPNTSAYRPDRPSGHVAPYSAKRVIWPFLRVSDCSRVTSYTEVIPGLKSRLGSGNWMGFCQLL